MKHTGVVVGAIAIGTMLLAGCGSVTTANNGSGANASSQNVNTTNSTGANFSNQATSNQATVANTASKTSGSGTSSGPSTSPQSASAQTLVRQSMKLAQQGKVVGVPYAVQQNIDAVHSAWGNPDSQASSGAGIYETYGRRASAFGINKGGQIFDVRSYGSSFHSITLADIESVLGKPGDERHTSDSEIYMYPAGADNQLLWVFSKSSTGTVDKMVNHVSVFWPQGTVNIMAATQPAPAIVMDNAPGTVGSLFTFSIRNPPTGYRLVELEWLPRSGTAVVNTFSQAVSNGQSGSSNPGFSISGDGMTHSFIYPSSMSGQTGTVRVIYQATSGAAMIGNSPNITLK